MMMMVVVITLLPCKYMCSFKMCLDAYSCLPVSFIAFYAVAVNHLHVFEAAMCE